ncbi:DUF5671 domain-containing protein [Cryobacterium sp. SO2]|uniref:DUF5671 domain-containing protein n=1 Tax=Cryobacterium sp. SO2 TaxID=1897060 RepID=UPI00223DA224|nr:DUF5671 domain-containing protein [Cryobacterium sp. SO2]WEO78186.1 DUF5671 domain-containing protein [Cryobacterium sp. SO2]
MTVTSSTAPARASAAPLVRRIVVYTILFVLVVLVASGLGDLLNRLADLATGTTLVGDTGGLAVSLTFTLIGGPLAGILGWFAWRRLADPAELNSLAWALYLVGMVTVAVVVAGTALLTAGAAAVTGDEFTAEATTGLVWAGVWAGHRFVLRRSSRRPTRLPGTAAVLGGTFGLVLGTGGAVTALTIVLDRALDGAPALAGDPWWFPAVQGLVWAVGGGLIWWWHWWHENGRHTSTPLAAVALVGVGILGGALLALAGTGTTLFVLLRLAVDRSEPLAALIDPLGLAVAAALVGGLVWVYHRGVVRLRPGPVREAASLVTSGIALVATATGIGVIVNALLAALTTPLAASDPRTLLLGGISSVLVGGPLWWVTWRPGTALDPRRRRSPGRGVYLVVVFGISAVVALITLLVIGFRLFDSVLGGDAGLLDRIRAPLGLLVATGLVAGYHFSVWRGDRAAAAGSAAAPLPAPPAPAVRPGIAELILIMGPGAEPVVAHLRELTGARVSYWQRTDAAPSAPVTLPTPGQVVEALAGVSGERVVLVVGADGALTVLPVTAGS